MFPIGIDDELDETKIITRSVGKARDVPERYKNTPQAYLEATHHPYAPFTGDTLDWESYVFDDATTFEGVTREHVPHGKGVMTFGLQGSGAGFKGIEPGDRYEGEFEGGFAHGVGMFTSSSGLVFKGEYSISARDGCGVEYDLAPWKKLIAKGMHPVKAWRKVKQEIIENVVMGTWNNGVFLTGPSDIGNACSKDDVRRMVGEVDSIVAKARMFAFKPGGDATFFKSQLAGAPIRPNQHPLHYPHGTLFMAPGPAGQTAAVPEDKALKKHMLREFHNYKIIHDQYNFDFKPASDSLMAKAMRWWNRQEKLRQKDEQLQSDIANRTLRKVQQDSGADVGSTTAEANPRKRTSKSTLPAAADNKEEIDDSDLLADAAGMQASSSQKIPVGSAFGSIQMTARQAGTGLHAFFDNLAKRAPPMPRLGPKRA